MANPETLYFTDSELDVIRKMNLSSGYVSTISTSLQATFGPSGITVDRNGSIYVTNEKKVRVISNGQVSILDLKFVDDLSYYFAPVDVVVDSFYNLYIVGNGDQSVGCLKKFTYPSYNSTILSKNVRSPNGVTIVNDTLLYVSDTGNHCVRSIATKGTQERVLAGSATGDAGQKDGNWDVARFNNPYGITTDKMLNIYVADSGSGWIRKINRRFMYRLL